MREEILQTTDVVIEEKLYPRDKVNETSVKEYKQAMLKGDKFPAIHVALFKKKYYLVDGRHRLEAHQACGDKYVSCVVQKNLTTLDEIYLASVRANMKHGTRLSKSDKIKIAFTLKDMKYDIESIAKVTGLDEQFVGDKIILKPRIGKIKNIISTHNRKTTKSGSGIVLPTSFREEPKTTEPINLVDEDTEKEIEANYQVERLDDIYQYLTNTKFERTKPIKKLLKKLKTLINNLNK